MSTQDSNLATARAIVSDLYHLLSEQGGKSLARDHQNDLADQLKESLADSTPSPELIVSKIEAFLTPLPHKLNATQKGRLQEDVRTILDRPKAPSSTVSF